MAGKTAGLTARQTAALAEGGWNDDGTNLPGWGREVKNGDGEQERQWVSRWVFSSPVGASSKWNAESGGEHVWRDSLDEALAWCDNRTRRLRGPGRRTKRFHPARRRG